MCSPTRSSWWSSGSTNRARLAFRAADRRGGEESAGRSATVGQSSPDGEIRPDRLDADREGRTARPARWRVGGPCSRQPFHAIDEPVRLRSVGDPDVISESTVGRRKWPGSDHDAERGREAAEGDRIRARQAHPQGQPALRLGPGPVGQALGECRHQHAATLEAGLSAPRRHLVETLEHACPDRLGDEARGVVRHDLAGHEAVPVRPTGRDSSR